MPHPVGQARHPLRRAVRQHDTGQRAFQRERHADRFGAYLARRGSDAQLVTLLKDHQQRIGVDESPSTFHHKLEHTLQVRLEAHRPGDRGRGLEAADGALELGAPTGDVLV